MPPYCRPFCHAILEWKIKESDDHKANNNGGGCFLLLMCPSFLRYLVVKANPVLFQSVTNFRWNFYQSQQPPFLSLYCLTASTDNVEHKSYRQAASRKSLSPT